MIDHFPSVNIRRRASLPRKLNPHLSQGHDGSCSLNTSRVSETFRVSVNAPTSGHKHILCEGEVLSPGECFDIQQRGTKGSRKRSHEGWKTSMRAKYWIGRWTADIMIGTHRASYHISKAISSCQFGAASHCQA